MMATVSHCCKCRIGMKSVDDDNICEKCVSLGFDITKRLQKRSTIVHCPDCDAWLNPPDIWMKKLDPSFQLNYCIYKLESDWKKVRLMHAELVPTDPSSKSIKLKVRVQRGVHGGIVRQTYVVEFVKIPQVCDVCMWERANPGRCLSSVKLMQKHDSHRQTFFKLEQLMELHGAVPRGCIKLNHTDQGIEFHSTKSCDGENFVKFLAKVLPVKTRKESELVFHDSERKLRICNSTFEVEIAPVCRDDLVFLHADAPGELRFLGPLVICTEVTNCITLQNPFRWGDCVLSANKYWASRASVKSVLNSTQLVEYVVVDILVIADQGLYAWANTIVALVSDFGKNDTDFLIRTHLGRDLRPGDHALGYDLRGANLNYEELGRHTDFVLPEAILVKKICDEERQEVNAEYQQFLRDLEENPESRFRINIESGTDCGDVPTVARLN